MKTGQKPAYFSFTLREAVVYIIFAEKENEGFLKKLDNVYKIYVIFI